MERRCASKSGAHAQGFRLSLEVSAAADTYVVSGTPNRNQGNLLTLELQSLTRNRALVRFDDAALIEAADGGEPRLRPAGVSRWSRLETYKGSVAWTYDARHLRATETVVGHAIALGYDDDGLLTSAGELTISRDPATGRVVSIANTHAEHTFLETRTYDPEFGELASIEYARDGVSLLGMTFVRDGLGRIERRTEVLLGGTPIVHEYEYDAAGRLAAVTRDEELVEAYEYDLNGNRILAEYGPVVLPATHDVQDRLESYGEWSLLHGANGELESRLTPDGAGVITEYDPFGGLATARIEVGGVVREYLNDARGRRLGTREDGALVGRWLWRSSLQPVAELDEAGALVARYVYSDGANVPDLVVTAEGERWRLVKDHLGSVRLVIDVSTGEVLRAMDFDAFGRVTSVSGAADLVPFGFAGGLWDSLTGLVRFGARDYDPETWRWTAKDPIRFDGGDANIYAYVGNDPVNQVDPGGKLAGAAQWPRRTSSASHKRRTSPRACREATSNTASLRASWRAA